METVVTVSDATPEGAALLDTLLNPVELAAQRARPRYQPGYTLAALADGRVVGLARLAHERRRMGAAVLDVAAVTLPADATVREALLEPVVVAAATAGLAWLQVADAPADERSGLAVCGLQGRLMLPKLPLTGAVLRPAMPDDAVDLTALGAALALQTPLSPERTTADWRWMIAMLPAALQVLEDERGRVVGYTVHTLDGAVAEAYTADAGVGRGLLAALGAQGVTVALLGPGHPLVRTALVHGGRLELSGPEAAAPQWGVIDLAAALRELAPEFGARLGRSRYQGWAGRIDLELDAVTVALDITATAVRIQANPGGIPDIGVKRIALAALPQVLLGYRSPADLRASGALQCAESDLGLLDILFPNV
jgi:hypothetical protein